MKLRHWLIVLAAVPTIAVVSLLLFQQYRYIGTILLWVLVLFPGVFLAILNQEYRNILQGRKDEILSIMRRGNTFAVYLKAFESSEFSKSSESSESSKNKSSEKTPIEKTMDRLFYRKFGRSKYRFPLGMNAFVGGLFVLLILVWSGAPMHLPADIANRIRDLPQATTVMAGLAGAFCWGLYDVLRRFEAVDLSPCALHSIWLRMLVTSVLAPMLSGAFTESLRPGIAFAIGLFPTKELFDFARGQARKHLNMTMSAQPAELPNLHKLQGLSEGMVDRLLDQGIESVAQLATADPIKLLLRTNIEWKTILDVIDEAILFNYFDDDVSKLRPFGIRGAIELASIQDALADNDVNERQKAEGLVSNIASALQKPESAIKNAILNAHEDVQVDFLWNLWGDSDAADELQAPQPVGLVSTELLPNPED